MDRLRRSDFHADILEPQRIDGIVALVHPSLTSKGAAGGISFTLSRRQMDNLPQVHKRVRNLSLHLLRALDLSLELGRHLASNHVVREFLHRTSVPSLLLDNKARVTFCNASAERLLAEADGFLVRQGEGPRLGASESRDDRALCEAIKKASAIASGSEESSDAVVRVTRPSGRSSLLVLVSPMPAASFPFYPAIERGGCVLVQVPGSQDVTPAQASILQSAVGLTRAEALVAALVGDGFSAPEAARRLGLSTSTVKSHLKRCYDKAEVRSQLELARLLATLPDRGHNTQG